MKKAFLFLSAGAMIVASCVGNPEGKKAEATDSVEVAATEGTSLNVDTAASSVEWLGKKVTGQHHGDVRLKSGSLLVNGGKLVGGNFVIDLNTINTQDLEGEYKEKLDGHLRSADFFDVENHPEVTFDISSVAAGATADVAVISGNLTIRGVSKNITFDAHIHEMTDSRADLHADFNIAREDWGVSYAGQADDLISKEINIKVNLVATK